MTLAPPIRKKFRGEPLQQGDPLPIPIASHTGFPSSAASWNYYSGIYRNGVVIVNDLNQIASLWQNGYFGQLKNTDLQNQEFGSEETDKYSKRWKLLETEGIKESSFFKKSVTNEDRGYFGISEKPETKDQKGDNTGRCKDQEKASDSFEISQENVGVDKYDPFSEDNADEGDSIAIREETERYEKTVSENCRTVLSFDSDHIPSAFFDDANVDNTLRGNLELLPEEAMFLSYALGCLVVGNEKMQMRGRQFGGKKNQGGKEFTIDQLWRKFVNDDPQFVARYAVYHHYRTKGWVVRSGLKFGADYVLYPVGPPFYHAQFTIMIQCIWSDTHERDVLLSTREVSWTNLSATHRLNTHVKKTPIITYVLRPRSLTREDLYKISSLKSLIVKELVLSRWDPTAAVEQDKEITLE